jgi:alkylated DNA repair protein (DNA oxidative demethylase)
MDDLFEGETRTIRLDEGAWLLGGFAYDAADALFAALQAVAAVSPLRHMVTPGGRRMSVSMTNCGPAGWVSDNAGYRYVAVDPETGQPWPALPPVFLNLAARAAAAGGFARFVPDACLINRYAPGARLTLHQDRDEQAFDAPIVSVSLGLPATFLWGGPTRGARPRRLRLVHGDVVVWGGPARMAFHGIDPLKPGDHPLTGAARYNLTFRRAFAS